MKKIVFFDVDNVLVKGQTQKILINFLFKKREISFLFFLKLYLWFLFYKLNIIKDTLKIRKKAIKLFENRNVLDINNLFREFFELEIKNRIFTESIKIIRSHIKQSYEVVLLSASLSEIVEEIKEYLSLNFAISTNLEIINGKYTGKIISAIPYGGDKVDRVRDLLNKGDFTLEDSYAYADHFSDLPLLELVAHPVVVNPDSRLRKIAKKRNWSIYDF